MSDSRARVVVRCDGSGSMGMGHVRRMLTLASELRERGVDSQFVVRAADGAASRAIAESQFDCAILSGRDGEAPLDEPDGRSVADLYSRLRADGAIIDHYGADAAYFQRLRDTGLRIGAIDDLATHDFAGVDWILNPAPGFEHSYAQEPRGIFAGPQYALLREEFRRARVASRREYTGSAARVLITLGGGDVAQWAAALIRGLERIDRTLQVRCTISSRDRQECSLREAMDSSKHEVRAATSESMAELMTWADLSINAAGQTVWELCCMGVPMVLMRLAGNQASNAQALESAGCAVDAGDWDDLRTPIVVRLAVERLLSDADARRGFSHSGMSLVDGLGACRAADEITGLWCR